MRLLAYAHCLNCEWRDTGKNPDLAARKHGESTGHSTVAGNVPEGTEP